jgi:hypothetical protein
VGTGAPEVNAGACISETTDQPARTRHPAGKTERKGPPQSTDHAGAAMHWQLARLPGSAVSGCRHDAASSCAGQLTEGSPKLRQVPIAGRGQRCTVAIVHTCESRQRFGARRVCACEGWFRSGIEIEFQPGQIPPPSQKQVAQATGRQGAVARQSCCAKPLRKPAGQARRASAAG